MQPETNKGAEMFLCLEGLDGAGKTTTVNLLRDQLDAVYVRTPSDAAVRSLLFSTEGWNGQPAKHLFAADMLRVDAEVVKPALAAGKVVIADRYLASTFTYQKLNPGDCLADELVSSLSIPDVTFFLVGDPAALLRRVGFTDHYETNDVDELIARERRYMKAFSIGCTKELVIVDTTSLLPDAVVETVMSVVLQKKFSEHEKTATQIVA